MSFVAGCQHQVSGSISEACGENSPCQFARACTREADGVRALICRRHLRSAPPQKIWHAAEDLWCVAQSVREQTSKMAMSALPPKADITAAQTNVRFVPKADVLHCSK